MLIPGPRSPGRPVSDRALDALAVVPFLDGARMKSILGSHLPWVSDQGLVIRDCTVDSVRYHSRAKDRARQRPLVSVSYRLDVADDLGRRRSPKIIYVEIHPRAWGRSPSRDSSPDRTVVHLPELDAIAWAFPNDPHMPHLTEVMDPERIKRHLPYDRLPAGLDGPEDVKQIEIEVLRYKPETHCAARFDVTWGEESDPQVHRLFGKTYTGDRADEIDRLTQAVRERALREEEGFVIASPLGHARAVKTIWQAALAGQPAIPVLARGDCDDVLAEAGAALAIFHETHPVTTRTLGIDDQLAEMDAQVGALVEAFPGIGDTLEPIAARLHEDAPRRTAVPASLVHGDFVAKNLQVHGDRIAVCDFDDVAVGDPLQDVACFLVDLHFLEDRDSHRVTLRHREPGVVEAMANVFITAYRSRAGWRVDKAHLMWHWRTQMLEKIHHYHKRQHLRPGFERDLDEMLAMMLARTP